MFVTQGCVVRGKNLPALKALVVSLTRWTSSSPLITREVWVDLVILTPRIFNSSVTLIYSRGELACFQPLHLPNASSWHFYVWGSLCSLLPEDFSKNEMMWSSVLNSSCDLKMHFRSSTNPTTLRRDSMNGIWNIQIFASIFLLSNNILQRKFEVKLIKIESESDFSSKFCLK